MKLIDTSEFAVVFTNSEGRVSEVIQATSRAEAEAIFEVAPGHGGERCLIPVRRWARRQPTKRKTR